MANPTRERANVKAWQEWNQFARTVVNDILRGRLNNVGRFFLAKDATSTTVSDTIVTRVSGIFLQAEQTLGHDYKPAIARTSVSDGSFVVSHVSTSTSTIPFTYVVF